MIKRTLLTCVFALTTVMALSASGDVRMAGNSCDQEGNNDIPWYWYQSRMLNNSTSTYAYVNCPVAGVDLANNLAGYVYVVDNSNSYVVCTLGTVNNNGLSYGYYGTRYSSGNSSTPTALSFTSGIPTLGRTPMLHCQIPPRSGTSGRSGMHSYTTWTY